MMPNQQIHTSREVKVTKYIFASINLEVHMVGQTIGIGWSLDSDQKRIQGPEVMFVDIRIENGVAVLEPGNPIKAGIKFEVAQKLTQEMIHALGYMHALIEKDKPIIVIPSKKIIH